MRQALWMAFWVSLPLLAIGFLASVVISLVQIVTSIQDASFGAVPRLVAFLAGILIFLPWMTTRLVGYTIRLLGELGSYAR
ncbi:MAG: flagellar biosynthetic protein FliQ [Bryobacterales bacterium]|nr:flagellar biosynthetic protein FliQ [Bryobacterales bacterium]